MCGHICPSVPNGAPACAAGKCTVGTCTGTFRDCDGVYANGCETDVSGDAANCGACNHACAAPTPSCVAGQCM
jgi:hypothetical protein